MHAVVTLGVDLQAIDQERETAAPAQTDLPKAAIKFIMEDEGRQLFQMMLFSKIVPNCKKLGLLDAGDGWLRTKFQELGVIQFEDLTDTSDEYQAFALDEAELSPAKLA